MGGDGGTKRANARMAEENEARNRENERITQENETKMRTFEYEGGLERAMQKAELDAAANVTAERTKGIKDSSSLLTDFEAQEKKRFLKAKTGVGQVDEGDTAISASMTEEARSLLNKGADYWDAKRGDARSTAAKTASDAYLKEHGLLSDFLGKGEMASAAKTRGRTYKPPVTRDDVWEQQDEFNYRSRR